MFAISIENLGKLKVHIFFKKMKSFYCLQEVVMNMKKIFKEEKSIEMLKIINLINNIEEHHRMYNHV